MATTSPDSISYPDASYTSGFVAAMAAMATSIQTALSKRGRKSYQWADATARGAQAGMATGDTGYQVDTAVVYRYNGSAWKAWESDWTSYVATLVNFTIGTGGSALNSTDYKWDLGRLRIRYRLYLGTSGQSVGTGVTVTTPVTLRAPSTANHNVLADGTLFDTGVATYKMHAIAEPMSTGSKSSRTPPPRPALRRSPRPSPSPGVPAMGSKGS